MHINRACWCGEIDLQNFSEFYKVCNHCGTLVSQKRLDAEEDLLKSDDKNFYGKEYFLSHMTHDLHLPDAYQRVRSDLPERCLYWLRTFLKYSLPPSKVLELGCGNGGFLAFLSQLGFDVMGLEVGQWMAEFAKKTFDISMLVGPIETQKLDKASFDSIVMMDVIEHLPSPINSIKKCAELLSQNGFLLIQTPRFKEEVTYSELVEKNDPFLIHLKDDEHLYLFSENSIKKFLQSLQFNNLEFCPAIFSHYDMFLVASKKPITVHSETEIDQILSATSNARMIQALLDLYNDKEKLSMLLNAKEGQLVISEKDRKERFELINEQKKQIKNIDEHLNVSEKDRIAQRNLINELTKEMEELNKDLKARLTLINDQVAQLEKMQKQLENSDEDRIARLTLVNDLSSQLEERQKQLVLSEEDRASRLDLINQLSMELGRTQKQLEISEEDRAARLDPINRLSLELEQIQKQLAESEEDRAQRLEIILRLNEQLSKV